MTRRFLLVLGVVVAMVSAGVAAAVTVDPVARAVSSAAFDVQFSLTNPEEVTSLTWNGSANLTATGVPCGSDPLEYFGNSWAAPDSIDFKSLVGWGQSGAWAATTRGALVDSVSESASGCYGAVDVPIRTRYQFWDRGPAANRIKVTRSFDFRSAAFDQDFRPYIPRLFPMTGFGLVYYPDASGTTLLSTPSAACPFGCQIADWDDSWFAMHDPGTGTGLIVRQAPTGFATDLWVDEDAASFTNSTGVLMLSPPGGFGTKVHTNTFLCFYDNTTWTPSLTLPPGC